MSYIHAYMLNVYMEILLLWFHDSVAQNLIGNNMSKITSSSSVPITKAVVIKTAFDAIQAKYSAAMVAGYSMVVDHTEMYQELIKHIASNKKRQTPLVNAGYACRVLAVSHRIRSFLSYHEIMADNSKRRRHKVQILLLGCGVDVIGIWAAKSLSTLDVTILEVDTPEICQVKRDLFSDHHQVEHLTQHQIDDTLIWYSGEIAIDDNNSKGDCNSSKQRYIMIPANLKDLSTLDVVLLDSSIPFDGDTPTLVLSELVLAYLPPTCTDSLLAWCATNFHRSESALVALEPLGFDNHNKPAGFVGVVEGYRRDYCHKFQGKMQRGQPPQVPEKVVEEEESGTKESALFYPIGTSTDEVTQRLLQLGFHHVSTTTLGVAATIAAAAVAATTTLQKTMTCTEIFDEHAALALHLRSYAMTCGMLGNNNELFRRIMCPWEGPNALPMTRAGLPDFDFHTHTVYTEIQVQDEPSVRTMFESTYKDHMKTYPSIRKLVKMVLSKELRETIVGHDRNNFLVRSTIAEHYQSSHGIFLVAVKYMNDENEEVEVEVEVEEEEEEEEESARFRRVIGFAGIKKCEDKDVELGTMEIFRLMVQEAYRGQGIATRLLQAVERYACDQQCPRILANTLTILDAASRLYMSCGYHAERETPLGPDLVLTTFAKTLNDSSDENDELDKQYISNIPLDEKVVPREEEEVDEQTMALSNYYEYEDAAPTVPVQRERRGSLVGHIQAWAGAVNQEHFEFQGGHYSMYGTAPNANNRRGSLDTTLINNNTRQCQQQEQQRQQQQCRNYLSSDNLANNIEKQIISYDDNDDEEEYYTKQPRRSSLDAMVEQAVAYVNLQPSPADHDLDPFGSRRDSLF
jgi:GNAT superfamily N-acetyltransferase/O-methyltransferase involved in polyketide biosynthesis